MTEQRKTLFSVIIPTFNRADQLKIALSSLVYQTFKDFEVVVCDDGSKDNTQEIAESFKNQLSIKYIREEHWGGPARPRNTGIINSIGDWICFLDSDDLWYPEKLEVCLGYLDISDFIYHDLEVVGEHIPEYQKQIICRKISTKNAFKDLLLNWNGIANSSVIVRKSILDKTGLFTEDKSLIGVEDFDMWLRIGKITNRFTLIPKLLGGYYLSPVSFSISTKKCIESDYALLEKYRDELTERQYLNVKAVVNTLGGIRHLIHNERSSANHYFYLALFNKSRCLEKIKALFFLIMGKHAFKFTKLYRRLQSRVIN